MEITDDYIYYRLVSKTKNVNIVLIILIVTLILAIYLLWTIDAQTRVAIIAAVVTISVGIFTIAKQKQKDLDLKMREQKIPAYENFLNLFKNILGAIHEKKELNEQDIIKQYRDINYALIIGGSKSVVRKWSEYYEWISNQPEIVSEYESAIRVWNMRLKLAQVAREIRRDLGHDDADLTDETIADLLLPLQSAAKQQIILTMLQTPTDETVSN